MNKNNYIALILLFVFSFMLIHNVIPHSHFDEVSEIVNNKHHDKKEDHQHNDGDEPVEPFSHPTHLLISTKFLVSADLDIQKNQTFSDFFYFTDIDIKSTYVPIKWKPSIYSSVLPLQHFYFTHSLRGPPSFLS